MRNNRDTSFRPVGYFLKIFVPPLIFLLFIGAYLLQSEYAHKKALLISEVQRKADSKENLLVDYYQNLIDDISYLKEQKELKRFLADPDKRQNLIDNFTRFEEINKSYNQLRILDTTGREIIRVDYRNANNTIVVPTPYLQDKSDRGYFKAGMTLQENEVLITKLGLNRERGEIEIPYNPVLRSITPLFLNGKKYAYLVTNFDARRIIKDIKNFITENPKTNFELRDDRNGLLVSESSSYENLIDDSIELSRFNKKQLDSFAVFGIIKHAKDTNIKKRIPLVSALILPENINQVKSETAFYTLNATIEDDVIIASLFSFHNFELVGTMLMILLLAIACYISTQNKAQAETRYADLKKANKSLIRNEAKLKKSKRMLEKKNEILEQYAFVASHDLKEPINSIQGVVNQFELFYKDKLDEEGKSYIQFLSDSSSRMKKMVENLLEYARLGREYELSEVDCNDIIDNIIQDYAFVIKQKNATILKEELPTIEGQSIELKLLFQNLIANSLKFVPEDRTPEIKISANKVANGWKFTISDNGIGMKEENTSRIFKLFSRLHGRSKFSGNGIGLAQCKKIIDNLKGKIWVNSTLGEGSEFHFILPETRK